MKDENNKTNKIVSILNYFSSICFYIVAIINFIKDNSSMGVIYLCLGSFNFFMFAKCLSK